MSLRLFRTPCWRCRTRPTGKGHFCSSCGAKLVNTRSPHPPMPKRDIAFIQDLYNFGWYNWHSMSVALFDAVMNVNDFFTPDRPEMHRLFVAAPRAQYIFRTRLFAEAIALFEAFGALCLAIQKRKNQSFIWTYLNSEPGDVTQFYERARKGSKSVSLKKLLNLPSGDVLSTVLAEVDTKGIHDLKATRETLSVMALDIRMVAEMYRDNQGVNVKIYNRIKHVFPVVEGLGWIVDMPEAEAVAVIVDDARVIEKGQIDLFKITMKQDVANQEMSNTRELTKLGSELLAMCIALERTGRLYE